MTRYRCKSCYGDQDGMIFESYHAAESRCKEIQKTAETGVFWEVESFEESAASSVSTTQPVYNTGGSSGGEFAGLLAVLFGVVGAVLTWLLSTKAGRKVFVFLAILVGVMYAQNAWENRAYVDTTHYENGNIKAEQSYHHKKLNGISKFYSESGKLEKEQNYKDGELDGLSTEYYSNGKTKTQQNYVAGKLNGVSTFYLENGTKEKEQTYKDDVKNGSSKIYYPSGTLKSEAMISNNKLNGLSILYDEKGNVLRKENFVNGKSTNIIE